MDKGKEGKTRQSFSTPCVNDETLSIWLEMFCGLKVPRRGVCPDHDSPFDYVRHAYFEPAGDVVVWAPRGGGKTRLAAAATLLDLVHKNGCAVRILGGSLDQSHRLWEHLRDDVRSHARRLIDVEERVGVYRFRNRSNVEVLAQSQTRVRGQRVQKLRCDEVELFDPKVWAAAQFVTRSLPRNSRHAGIHASIEAFSTMHRRHGLMRKIIDHARANGTRVIKWCLLDVLEKCPPERQCATCPLWEDCGGVAKTRCEGFFRIEDAIAQKARVSVESWRAEMLCHRPSESGCVFPSFDRSVHVRDDLEPSGEMTLGIDFGFRNPFVALWICERGDGTVQVFDEYIRAGRTIHEHLKEIESRGWGRVGRIACDPSGAARNEQTARSNVGLLRRAGYSVRTRGSAIQEGLEMIRAALRPAHGPSRLFVHSRCGGLIQALESYHYAETGSSELPVKDNESDHPVDALRYFFVNRPGGGEGARRY